MDSIVEQPVAKRCSDTALTIFLFMSFTTMSAGRGAMPVTIVQMAEEFHWDKTTVVNT